MECLQLWYPPEKWYPQGGSFSKNFRKKFDFGWGALPPRLPGCGLGEQSLPRPPLKWSFVTFDRGGQTGPPRSNDFFFGAADDTRAARTSGRTSGRTPGRTPADDTGAADRKKKKTFFFFLGLGFQAWVPIKMIQAFNRLLRWFWDLLVDMPA